MDAVIVVGSGYGDEGKGLITDTIVNAGMQAGARVLNIRANGGTQAAHTVRTPDGTSHVFKTHGAGSLAGADTYLGPEFLVNPIGIRMERATLPMLEQRQLYCSGEAAVTLPVDMMINQLLEERRGTARHGSCGWGIGETVERGLHPQWRISVKKSKTLSLPELAQISDEYVSWRLHNLGIPLADLTPEWQLRLQDEGVLHTYLADVAAMHAHMRQLHPADLDHVADILVFEGAQGLGLDQDGEHFPHVTRSCTGSGNALSIIAQVGGLARRVKMDVQLLYVTRAYATRHGAGPLEHEGELVGVTVDDPTNQPNQWQGSLRSAPLDVDLTATRIRDDFARVLRVHPEAMFGLALTCNDQVQPDSGFFYYWKGKRCAEVPARLAADLCVSVRMPLLLRSKLDSRGQFVLYSTGPTRTDVAKLFYNQEWLSAEIENTTGWSKVAGHA